MPETEKQGKLQEKINAIITPKIDGEEIEAFYHFTPLSFTGTKLKWLINEVLDEAKADLFDTLGSENLDDIADAIKKWFGDLK